MFEDASTETIKPNNNWINKTRDQRISIVSTQLKKFAGAEDFIVVEADENGQIIIAIENGLLAIELVRNVPEALRPRKIEITSKKPLLEKVKDKVAA